MSLKPAKKAIVRILPVLVLAVTLLLAAKPATAADPSMPEMQGRIDRIDYNNEVVIDDVLFYLTPHTKYYSALGKDIPGSEFVKGTSVAYSLMPGRLIILTLWKIE